MAQQLWAMRAGQGRRGPVLPHAVASRPSTAAMSATSLPPSRHASGVRARLVRGGMAAVLPRRAGMMKSAHDARARCVNRWRMTGRCPSPRGPLSGTACAVLRRPSPRRRYVHRLVGRGSGSRCGRCGRRTRMSTSGRAGAGQPDSASLTRAAQVCGPTMPSTANPGTMARIAFWKPTTHARVLGPKIPSTVSEWPFFKFRKLA